MKPRDVRGFVLIEGVDKDRDGMVIIFSRLHRTDIVTKLVDGNYRLAAAVAKQWLPVIML